MAINTIPREILTGSCKTSAGAINDLSFLIKEQSSKAFETLRAKFTLRGHTLHWIAKIGGRA